MGTCEKQTDVLEPLARLFKHRFSFKNPERPDRETIISWLLTNNKKLKMIEKESF
jgi:hypothetical protein